MPYSPGTFWLSVVETGATGVNVVGPDVVLQYFSPG